MRATARLLVLAVSCSLAPVLGCGGGDFELAAPPDAGADTETSDARGEDTPAAADTTSADADATEEGAVSPSDASSDASSDSTSDAVDAGDSSDASDGSDADGAHEAGDASVDAAVDSAADAGGALPCDAPVVCWKDADGDGYAPAGAASSVACACATGTTTRSPAVIVDCNDEDPRVFPGATTYRVEPYCVPGTACASKSFDYDCDGSEEKQYGPLTSCSSGCAGVGWSVTVPMCGASGTLVSCKPELLGCSKPTSSAKHGCR